MSNKTKKSKVPEMSFWEHIDAFRSILIRMVLVVLGLMIFFFVYMRFIFDTIILAPCRGDFILYQLFNQITQYLSFVPEFSTENFNVELINIKLASQFFIHMSTSFWLAIVFAFPIILYLIWGFIKPALYKNELKGIRTALSLGSIMFYIGIACGYLVIFPVTLRFLAEYQVSTSVPNQISLDSYMDNFLALIFIMGVTFEMPLLAWTLSAVGILKRSFFRKFRRYAIVILLVTAAIITPTGDPFTLMLVFCPLFLLYELSALLVKKDEPIDDDDDPKAEQD